MCDGESLLCFSDVIFSFPYLVWGVTDANVKVREGGLHEVSNHNLESSLIRAIIQGEKRKSRND